MVFKESIKQRARESCTDINLSNIVLESRIMKNIVDEHILYYSA